MNTTTRKPAGYVRAPQSEFAIDGGFALMRETAEDGERIAREREQRSQDKQAGQTQQPALL